MADDDFVKTMSIIYKILDFLPDSDPLKNLAKEKVLAILENLTLQNFLQASDDIAVLENYLKVGFGQGWISSMNFLIITKEYQKMKDNIEIPKDIAKSSVKYDRIEKYSQRQSKILEILNKKENAQVSDFIKELPKVTKRTIRRDLDDLLKRGKISRAGEWNQVFYQKMS